ncbi:Hypothetical predicted protein [Mytilus galloprovincialis]|uniref:DUF6570 domain-containing protein n=1 Tax=Mytilus galloprovincialis TaxID=29158 RepID=A0A8B6DLI4_MYTGA|nr:Hypothetical predicted protein [Mytilus galloprovincialis]
MPRRKNWRAAEAKRGVKNPKKQRLTDLTWDTGPINSTKSDLDIECTLNNPLDSSGKSILIGFADLHDLLSYLYAFYTSLQIDLDSQYEILPVCISSKDTDKDVTKQIKNYFRGSETKEHKTKKSFLPVYEGTQVCIYEILHAKKKKRIERQRELAAKREVRKDKNYRRAEAESKKSQRDNSDLRQIERQRELVAKREVRKDKNYRRAEAEKERLLSLRIPFMQIRQLPRGGQLSVKGNVVNVPVEVQPTINSLPHTLREKSGTISVKLKKKLEFKKCDFSENVRPFAVICALHYLMRTSDLYKSSGIEINEDWITEIAKINEEEIPNEKIVQNKRITKMKMIQKMTPIISVK